MSDKRSVLPNFGVDQAFADRQNLAPHKSSSRGGTAGKAALFKNEETRPRWRVGREEILSRQPARADGPAQLGRNHQGAMDLRDQKLKEELDIDHFEGPVSYTHLK